MCVADIVENWLFILVYDDIHTGSGTPLRSHSPPLLHHHQQINQLVSQQQQLPETQSQLHTQSQQQQSTPPHQTANNSSLSQSQSNTVASSQTQIVASSTASESPASVSSQPTGKFAVCNFIHIFFLSRFVVVLNRVFHERHFPPLRSLPVSQCQIKIHLK